MRNTSRVFAACIVRSMVGEMILMVSVALGCALLGCGTVYLAAKIPTRRMSRSRPDEARTLGGSTYSVRSRRMARRDLAMSAD
jgi:hypothetical protein